MKTLILTLDPYDLIILVSLSLGCTGIANYIYLRYFSTITNNVILIHAIIKTMIVMFGLSILPYNTLYSKDWWIEITSIPLGIGAGYIIVALDKKIIRYLIRTKKHSLFIDKNYTRNHLVYKKTYSQLLSLNTGYKLNQRNNINRLSTHIECINFDLISSILVSVCEEIIFRGFLVTCILIIPELKFRIIALLLSIIFFGLSHSYLGLEQVLTKTILGLMTLFLRIKMDTLLPAVATHITLNIAAYFEAKSSREKREKQNY